MKINRERGRRKTVVEKPLTGMANMDDFFKGTNPFQASRSLTQLLGQLLDDFDVAGKLYGRDRVGL